MWIDAINICWCIHWLPKTSELIFTFLKQKQKSFSIFSKTSKVSRSFDCQMVVQINFYNLNTIYKILFAFAFQAIEHPVPINPIPRQIPDQSICTQPIIGILLGGILPFGCILTQSFFILNALWSTQTYSMFEYLYLIFWILIITCAETAIILCYFHLRAENYHWWWRSFFTSGCTAFYFFIYCSHYFITKLPIEDKTSTILYFGYTLIMTFLFFLMTGSIGFVACFWFVRKIYSVAKV